MKNLSEIWNEYCDMHNTLSPKTILSLNRYITHDDSENAICAATDMIKESSSPILMKKILIPSIAKQLDNKDSSVRRAAIESLIGQLEIAQHANKSFYLARHDSDDEVRQSATANLGYVINKVDKNLAQEIALYLYDVITNEKYDSMNNDDYKEMKDFYEEYGCLIKDCAARSINNAMEILPPEQFDENFNFNEVWKDFIKKYQLELSDTKFGRVQITSIKGSKRELQNLSKEKEAKFDNVRKVHNVQNRLKNIIKNLIKSLKFYYLNSQERQAAEEALCEAQEMLQATRKVVPYISRK